MHAQGWCRGNVTIIGDAAHAGLPNGQGLNLAIEDGDVLASLAYISTLSRLPSIWERLLDHFSLDTANSTVIPSSSKVRDSALICAPWVQVQCWDGM